MYMTVNVLHRKLRLVQVAQINPGLFFVFILLLHYAS